MDIMQLRPKLLAATNSRIFNYFKAQNGHFFYSMLKKDEFEYFKAQKAYFEYKEEHLKNMKANQPQPEPQDEDQDYDSSFELTPKNENWKMVKEKGLYQRHTLHSNINLKKTRIMHMGEELTIANWIKNNHPYCRFMLKCMKDPQQPFVTEKTCEWEIGFQGDFYIAEQVTGFVQTFLNTFRLKVMTTSNWTHKQLAFKRKVNAWNNPYRDEVFLYAFGPDAQENIDAVFSEIEEEELIKEDEE